MESTIIITVHSGVAWVENPLPINTTVEIRDYDNAKHVSRDDGFVVLKDEDGDEYTLETIVGEHN